MHHALVCYDTSERTKELTTLLARELGMSLVGNPDLHIRHFDVFGVDDARTLSKLAALTSAGGGNRGAKKLFILAIESLTREAQNALLKTFEEPTEDTYFALLVPRGSLISTLRSRTIEITLQKKVSEHADARTFLASAPAARSKLITKIIEDKEKHRARAFLESVERVLGENLEKKEVREALSEVEEMRGYLMGASPSIKMILEHLAITLPTVPAR